MRRPSKKTASKHSTDSQRLTELVQTFLRASSRLEERAWEHEIETLIHKHFKAQQQAPIDDALQKLFVEQSEAFDVLVDIVEACSESDKITIADQQYDCLLIAIPLLAWTRFSIASGSVSAELISTLDAHLHAHILAPEVKTKMMPMLYAIDQLPGNHIETFSLLQKLVHAALETAPLVNPKNLPETVPFLADIRYLLTALVVPQGMPLFRWQLLTNDFATGKEQALQQWSNYVTPLLTRLLPGCSIQLLLPEAYFSACREANLKIRPASLHAASYYLAQTLEVAPQDLHASIGRFSEQPESGRVDEYRIGFSLGTTHQLVYGVIWPLYGEEEIDDNMGSLNASETPLQEITKLLRLAGIVNLKQHADLFAMEYCDDCETPLYPNVEGDLIHPQMPEEIQSNLIHFH